MVERWDVSTALAGVGWRSPSATLLKIGLATGLELALVWQSIQAPLHQPSVPGQGSGRRVRALSFRGRCFDWEDGGDTGDVLVVVCEMSVSDPRGGGNIVAL